jgi:glutamate carboxypeptidase
MMDLAEAAVATLGATIERVPGRDGFGDLVKARVPGRGAGPGIHVLGHLDTVHPVGTIEGPLKLRREGDKVYGPGIFDMKSGVYLAYYALRQLVRAGRTPPLPVTFMFIPDEEVGSPSTRALIEAEARRSRYVLVPEPAQDEGRLITGRFAFLRYRVRTTGRPAHAGAYVKDGRNAIGEMTRQIQAIEALSDHARGITYSVGVIAGGTFVNVVPTCCEIQVLAVSPTEAGCEEIRARMAALAPTDPEIGLEVIPGPVRPLFAPNEGSLGLYAVAAEVAKEFGFEVEHGHVGGGSDGNFTGALGIPTLDGLGTCGAGFHTHGEHILVSSLVPRARLLAGLMERLT